MKLQVGDIVDHYADIPGEKLHLMSRYIVLDTRGENIKLYVLKGYTTEGITNAQEPVIIADWQKPGDIEMIGKVYLYSKEETPNNFYYEVVDAI